MKNEKRNIFSLIVSILTMVIMTLGATFAFYTSTTNEKDKEKIQVSAATFKLSLNIAPLYTEKAIVPTDDEDIITAFENECVDIRGFGACYAYELDVEGIGDVRDVLINLRIEKEELPNLKYIVLDADNENEIYKPISYASEEFESIGESFDLIDDTRKFVLIIWVSNLSGPQDEEQNRSFTGIVTINSSSGSKITGTINQN